jgi:flagellin
LIVDAVNKFSAQTGVTAEALDDDTFQLLAADGRNIDVSASSEATLGVATNYGTVRIESAGQIDISTQSPAAITNSGFEVGTFGGGDSGQRLSDINVSTVAAAEKAITAVDNAIKTVSSQAAQLGAVQNRFESTISNLSVTQENLSAANSRIKDADFAAETAELSRSQVLQQAGTSILAQANARPQQVLSLLQ